jgi:hypothetical protein
VDREGASDREVADRFRVTRMSANRWRRTAGRRRPAGAGVRQPAEPLKAARRCSPTRRSGRDEVTPVETGDRQVTRDSRQATSLVQLRWTPCRIARGQSVCDVGA